MPSKTSFRDNSKGKNAIKGFEYCENLPEEMQAVQRLRAYRLDPPCDHKKIGKKTTDIEIWEGKLPFKAEDFEQFFYHKFGAGAYKVIVEEQGVSGIICDIWFTLPDRDTYPPKVDDRTLCLDAPGGKEYAEWRARRGEPVQGYESQQQPNSEMEDFMQVGQVSTAASAVTTMAEGMVKMAERAIDNAGKAAAPDALQQQQPDILTHAASESIKLIADTSRDIMKNSHAPDPVEMVKSIVGLLPQPADPTPMFQMFMSLMKESNNAVAQMQAHTIQRLETRLADIETRAHNPSGSTALAPQDGMAELERFQKMANLLGYSRDTPGGSATPQKSFMEEWQPIIQMGMQILGPLMQALAIKLTAPPANGAAVNPQPSVAQTPPPPAAAAPPPPPPDSPQAQMLKFLQQIEKPFLNHLLSPNFTGYDFALHILTDGNGGSMETPSGRAQYNGIKQGLGMRPDNTCGLDQLIQTYPPIWDIAKGDKPSYRQFLSEFFSYDDQAAAPAPKPS